MNTGDYIAAITALLNVAYATVTFIRGHKLTLRAVEKTLYNNRQLIAKILGDLIDSGGQNVAASTLTAETEQK